MQTLSKVEKFTRICTPSPKRNDFDCFTLRFKVSNFYPRDEIFEFVPPPPPKKNGRTRVIGINSYFSGNFDCFTLRFEVSNFYPRDEIFEFDNNYQLLGTNFSLSAKLQKTLF